MTVRPELASARTALDRGDPDAAIRILVALWREVPDTRLAEAIEALSPRTARAGVAPSTAIRPPSATPGVAR